jgi:RHS repeat-associated protein
VGDDGYAVEGSRYGGRGVTLYGKGEAVAVSYSSSNGSRSTYLGKDVLGSVRTATTDTGAVEDRYEYDAFGTVYQGDLSGGMNLGYTGKPYDTATGLYNYGYRDYSPQVARFTTVDPIRDGNNWFAYVNNDPVNFIDLWGLEIILDPSTSETDRRYFDEAMEYLKTSPTAAAMIERLEESDEIITVTMNNTHNDEYLYRLKIVKWDPTSGLKTGTGGIQTPALGLGHEFGHADVQLSGRYDFITDEATYEQYKMQIEEEITKDYESVIARELGESERRYYNDNTGPVRVQGPTSSQKSN